MNILEFEKFLLDNKFDTNKEFLKILKENFENELDLTYPNKNRKLTEEETIFEYFDDSIAQLFESLEGEIEDKEHCGNCCCSHVHTEEEVIEERVKNNRKVVYKLALYLLREGIHYEDLSQEGLLGLINAANFCKEASEFEKYKLYFIVKAMFEHIKKYAEYRELAFKEYIKKEKEELKKIKISLKVKSEEKEAELKKLEEENKEKHKLEIEKLENLSKNMFSYFNLKYRLSLREIEALSLYFALDSDKRKNFTDIENIMNINSDDVDKLLRESLFKLSVTDEKVEL